MQDNMSNIEISDKLDSVVDCSIRKLKIEKRRRTIRNAAVVGCLCLGLLGTGTGFCFTHTAYASKLPIVGSIFSKMNDKNLSYKGNLESDAKHLISGEDIEKLEKNEKIVNPYVQTSNGITVSITEVNYDRTGIYLGMVIQSDTAFPEGLDHKKQNIEYTPDYNYFSLVGRCTLKDSAGKEIGKTIIDNLEGDYTDDKTFVGVAQIDLSYVTDPSDQAHEGELSKIDIPDNFTCDIDIHTLCAEHYQMAMDDDPIVYYDGSWKYNLDVAFDPASYQTVSVNDLDENGYGIEAVNKSKYTITVDTKLPSRESGYFVVVCDANGDKLDIQGSYAECYSITNRDVSKVYVFVCDEDLYMDKLKGYYFSDDYDKKKLKKTFAQYLEEHSEYSVEVEF